MDLQTIDTEQEEVDVPSVPDDMIAGDFQPPPPPRDPSDRSIRPLDEIKAEHQSAFDELDDILAQAQAEFGDRNKPKYTLPEVMGDFRAVEGKPGIYMRPMCLEVELRAMELFALLSDGTAVGTARIAAAIAQSVLYRAQLPADPAEAHQKVVAYVRGQIDEDEVFHPLTDREVGRAFLNTEELSDLVLVPLGLKIQAGEESEKDPNAPAPTG